MAKSTVAVSVDARPLEQLDRLVERAVFPSRSQAVRVAVEEKSERLAYRCVQGCQVACDAEDAS